MKRYFKVSVFLVLIAMLFTQIMPLNAEAIPGGLGPGGFDSDGDGLSDMNEGIYDTNPFSADSDGDGMLDGMEVFVYMTNPAVFDSCPPIIDSDLDGLLDEEEGIYDTYTRNPDSDGDGLLDGIEVYIYGTDPTNADTDGDGADDFLEVIILGTDPNDPLDPDHIAPILTAGEVERTSESNATLKFTSNEEGLYYCNIGSPVTDTSGPGISCSTTEQMISLTSLSSGPQDIYIVVKDAAGNASSDTFKITIPEYIAPDADGDGLSDDDELNIYGTDPTNADTDGDLLSDGDEVLLFRTDPLDPLSPDKTSPILTAGDVTRISESSAIVKFTSDEEGEYYYNIGSQVTVTGPRPGMLCNTSEQAIFLPNPDTAPLTAGPKDIYIVVKDAAGNASSDTFKITIPEYIAPDADGDGLSDDDELNIYGTDPTNADTDGDLLSDGDEVLLFRTDPLDPLSPDKISPILTAGDVTRISESSAIVKFTSDEEGEYYYNIGSQVTVTGPRPGMLCNTSEQAIFLPNPDTAPLTAGPQDIYIVVKDAAGNASSDTFKITIPAYVAPSTSSRSSHDYFRIIVTQSEGGKISPNAANVREGSNKTFTMIPDEGYIIKDLLIDGEYVGPVSEYIFENIRKKHTITAEFEAIINEHQDEDEWENPFEDVKEDDWFYYQVKMVNKLLLMTGTREKGFEPRIKMTRGMIVTVLYNMADKPSIDTDETNWYANGKAWAMKNNISDGTRMEGNITREQVVSMIWRYQGSPLVKDYQGLTKFKDVNEISDYALQAMKWAHKNDIIEGKGNDILDPKGDATRAEIATLVVNYMNAMEK